MIRCRLSRGAKCLAAMLFVASGTLNSSGAVADGLVDTIDRVKGGIVAVGTYQTLRRPPAKLRGTGFAVADGRHVLTNAHVLPKELDTARKEYLAVFIGNSAQLKVRRIKVVDRDDQHDVALLKLLDGSLPALRLGNSESVMEGASIAVTGFPLASILGFYPVTHSGIIAAIKPAAIPVVSPRQLNSKAIQIIRNRLEIYQLDLTAFPGNSGSPLYDISTGEVVGIVSSVFVQGLNKESAITQPTGITYAIPVRHLRDLLRRNDIKG